MHQFIAFTTVRGPHGWLGNLAPYPVRHDGRVWRTSEALFQGLRFDDATIQETIRRQKSPMAGKFTARHYKAKMVVVPWSRQDLANMEMVLRLKLEQHPELRQKLLVTGSRQIIEDCTSRPHGSGLFWGAARNDGQWVGKNRLGKLWMKLREEVCSPALVE
jgi:ribA/ribD-fused uncharacterized protein